MPIRITSYNVCYTKLLRLSGVSAALVGDYLTTIGTNINQDKALFAKTGFKLAEIEVPEEV